MSDLGSRVVLINPLSSGKYLVDAFLEIGVPVVSVYEPRWKDGAARDEWSSDVHVISDSNLLDFVRSLDNVLAVVPGSEDGVQHSDWLASEIGLPHNSLAERLARRDKGRMVQLLERQGIPVPWSRTVTRVSEAIGAFQSCPSAEVIVKPLDSAGGDQVSICQDESDVQQAFERIDGSENFMRNLTYGACVQERLVGQQFAVNTISKSGVHHVTEVYEQEIHRLDSSAQASRHMLTVEGGQAVSNPVVGYTLRCLDALGIREGLAHTEVILTTYGPRIVEVNSRLMGPLMEPDPYARALGFVPQNVYAQSVMGVGIESALVPKVPQQYLARTYIRTRRSARGVISAVRNIDDIRALPGFHSLQGLARVGTVVQQGNVTTGSTGIAYFVHPDRSVLVDALACLHELEDRGHFYELSEVS